MPGWHQQPDPAKASPSRDAPPSVPPPLTQGLQDYLCARIELLALESQEAAAVAKQKGTLGLAMAVTAIFGYALILVALVALTGNALSALLSPTLAPFSWPIAALLFGILHFLAAYLLYNKLRRKAPNPLFEITRSELEKDRQWIHDQQIRNENGN